MRRAFNILLQWRLGTWHCRMTRGHGETARRGLEVRSQTTEDRLQQADCSGQQTEKMLEVRGLRQ